ncbi:Cation/H(+) antiporter 15 [Forsythia ovata]|uniref:Cation/H(+) antiporter 15 n=1 Tax=Forsythia ovata TaxID=205694 RepID=A0ABD1WJH3_9LAMI
MDDGDSSPDVIVRREFPGNLTDDMCSIDISLHSTGVWDVVAAKNFLHFALPRLQLQLAVIFLLTQSLHLLLRRFHMPRILSELLAGIILGPTILGQIPNFQETLFPQEGDIYIDILSKTSFVFYIFLSGVKMDPKTVMKTGSQAWTIGVVAATAPVSIGLVFYAILEKILHRYRWPTCGNIIGIQNCFAFPVIASMLVDLKIINSELGRLALASSLISDFLSGVVITIYSIYTIGSYSFTGALTTQSVFLTIGLILLIIFMGRTISLRIIQKTPEGKSVTRAHIILMSLMVLVTVVLTDNVGLPYQYGPFILGLVVPDGPPLGSTLVDRLETIISGLFTPLLITFCGLKVNLFQVYDLRFMGWVWFFVCFFLGVKLLSIFCPAVLCKVPIKDAGALAFIMSTQGVVQMNFYYSNFINRTFDGETFSMLNAAVLILIATTHLMAKSLYDYSRMYTGYQKRDIQHISPNSELRVLACAHRIDDVLGVRKILEASFPTRESPLSVYALHLVELVGRASPLLIDHQLGQKSSNVTRTQKMIEVLYAYEQQYLGLVSVQQFTAMSLTKFMHHDICSVAFDKLASLIILPFHRKWTHQGKMILDSNVLRVINTNVLENAPCSVSILVDRHKIRRMSPLSSGYNVGLAFFGGTDDREALAYAKRMAKSPGVHLTVVRFVPWDFYAGDSQWDAVLDAEILKETRMQGAHQDNILYREERVKDGAETALLIHAMEEAFDLIIVGRCHSRDMPQLLGLSEWNDLPELGPVGDMLAASELNKPVSVLVVQHQILKKK